MAQDWNQWDGTNLPWQNTALPWKDTNLPWNTTTLPWKENPTSGASTAGEAVGLLLVLTKAS